MNTHPAQPVELTNWSRSARSSCWVTPARDTAELAAAMAAARAQQRSILPHGAGHSYTDAALNTNGLVLDLTPMRRILAWDPAQGLMRVEPGVTLRDVVRRAAPDGWWPVVSPSTAEVTVGGCAAMNVNGKNAWKCGPFGAHILALDILLTTGESLTVTRDHDPELMRAFVGSLGLLGLITSITLQLERVASGQVAVRRRSAGSLRELLALFTEEEPHSDFMEAWLDGSGAGPQLGRAILTCAAYSPDGARPSPISEPSRLDQALIRLGARLSRPVLSPTVQIANRANFWREHWRRDNVEQQALFPYTYWSAAIFAGYQALLPQGAETFQAFVPKAHAPEVFAALLRDSQAHDCRPIWCIIKQHRRDPFLLSYQLDGFSLELNYPRGAQPAGALEPLLRRMVAAVLEAGGRFYLAKDHLLTGAQYRRSVGDEAVDTFLSLKARFDPEGLLQSDLFRRVFQPAA